MVSDRIPRLAQRLRRIPAGERSQALLEAIRIYEVLDIDVRRRAALVLKRLRPEISLDRLAFFAELQESQPPELLSELYPEPPAASVEPEEVAPMTELARPRTAEEMWAGELEAEAQRARNLRPREAAKIESDVDELVRKFGKPPAADRGS